MPESSCISCRRPKVAFTCPLCDSPSCKDCAGFLDDSSFALMPSIPDELAHPRYCQNCFQSRVEPELESYREVAAKAEDVYVFFTTQRKSIPLIWKAKESVQVKECSDRDETILRLAFQAAKMDCNAVIETDVRSEKLRHAGYQKSIWRGTGIPAKVDEARIEH